MAPPLLRRSSSARCLSTPCEPEEHHAVDAKAAIARAVSSALMSPESSSHIAIAPPRPANDRDCMEGYMVLHAKKPKKKLFKLHRSSYYVVADAAKPVLELYTNDSRSELVYSLSLVGAELGFESDDAHAVMAKCFCVTVKTWKKRATVFLRAQGFVFFQQDQARMLAWVKCIHGAIKRAASNHEATDEDFFRCSTASTATSEPPSGDESERTAATQDDGSQCSAEASTNGGENPPAVAVQAPTPVHTTPLKGRRHAAIDPISTSPCAAKAAAPFPRLHSVFATIKSPTMQEIREGATATSNRTASATDKAPSPFSPRLRNPLHMPKTKSASTRHVAASGITSPSKRSSDAFQFRRKEDGLFGGLNPFFTPRGPRSAPKQKLESLKTTPFKLDDSPTVTQSLADFLKGTKAQTDSLVDGNSNDQQQQQQTLEARLSVHLTRLLLLLVACVGGVCELSIFLPVAAAGVFSHFDSRHADHFSSAAVASLSVFATSYVQLSLGLCTLVTIVYCWSYADFRSRQRERRVRIADRLAEEEQANFAHLEIPNWVVRPDVDRVEWLNKVLVTGWPFIKIAIRNSLMVSLNPLLDSCRPTFMSSLALVRVDLGNRTPIISGVKFVSANTKTEEVTLDVDLRIVTDHSLVAELRMVSNLGAAAVISLRDLFLVGTLRITLAPLTGEYWPCFSALSLSFTERPVFDFSLTAAKINIASVPFASEWLHTVLHDLLMDYFVWPKVAHIPLWDETATSTP